MIRFPLSSSTSNQLSLRHGQIFRAIGWSLGLLFVFYGTRFGIFQTAWPGYVAGTSAVFSCVVLWFAAPHLPRWLTLFLWLSLDTVALTILMGASGFHNSPLFIWLLAPAAAAVLEGKVWLVWVTAAGGLACYLGVEAWGQAHSLIKVPWAEVFWRGFNLFGAGAIGLDVASGWLRRLSTSGDLQDLARYRVLLENVNDGYYESDLHGCMTFCNTGLAVMLGYQRADEIIGQDSRRFASAEDWKQANLSFRKAYKDHQDEGQVAFRITRPNGGQRDLEVSISAVLDEQGEVTGYRGTARDITERLQAEQALAASEVRHRTLFELSADGLILLGDEYRIVDCNRRMAHMLGMKRADLMGLRPWDFSPDHQDDGRASRQGAVAGIERALQGNRQLFEWNHQHADGRTVPCEIALQAVDLEEGQTVVFASVRDLTERHTMTAELAASRELYRSLWESASHDEQVLRGLLAATGDPVIITDPAGNCLFINRAFSDVFGFSGQEVLGKPLEFVPTQEIERSKNFMETVHGGSQVMDFVTKRLTKAGRSVEVSLTGSAIIDELGKPAEALIILRDITAQVENERVMRRLYETQKELAQRDPLTGLHNHRRMQSALEMEIQKASAQLTSLAVVMIDLDGFKVLNDTYGHLVGDEALRLVAKILGRNCRAEDHVARWGGDEFMLILPGSNCRQAQAVCARITQDMASQNLEIEDGVGIRISASLGVALFPLDAASPERLLASADSAMYLAKARPGPYVTRLAANSSLVDDRAVGFDLLLELTAGVEENGGSSRNQSKLASHWSAVLGRELGLPSEEVEQLVEAALIHDVGKACLPGAWLQSGAELDGAQSRLVGCHGVYGAILIDQLSDLGPVARQAVLHQHNGYGRGRRSEELSGKAIPLPGRILALCVAYAELCNDGGPDEEEVARRLGSMAGENYDPELTSLLLKKCLDQTRPGDSPI